jgi:hypothetical protein
MRSSLPAIYLILGLIITASGQGNISNESNMSCDFTPESENIYLALPAEAQPGQDIAVRGWGADPEDLITLSLRFALTRPADVQANSSLPEGSSSQGRDTTSSCPLTPILGAKLCFLSDEYISVQIRPASCGLLSWQHHPELEKAKLNCDFLDQESNPGYYPLISSNDEIYQEKPKTANRYCSCLTLVLAVKPLSPEVKLICNAKRTVQADKNGKFSTIIGIPNSKALSGNHVLIATGSNRAGMANITINDSAMDNEPPYSLIYAPDLEDKNWKLSPGETFVLDGRALSLDNDGSIASFHWDLGDGTTSQEPVITHTYSQSGEKEVSLTLQDDEGASDTSYVTINVE